MSPFLKAVEARALAEREARLVFTPGRRIPSESPGNPGRAGNETLRLTILRMTRQHPDWTPVTIAAECDCAAITVRKIQRDAGVYRQPVRVGGNQVVMP